MCFCQSKIPRSTNRREFQRCLLVCRMCYAYHLILPYCKPHTHRRIVQHKPEPYFATFSFFSSIKNKVENSFSIFIVNFGPIDIITRICLVPLNPRTVALSDTQSPDPQILKLMLHLLLAKTVQSVSQSVYYIPISI